uniref:G protein-coupled receptor n=1 Tax=Hymenolepis diminuta TaxID=6216 RepID=A0A0R3SAT2_HYMDI
LLLDRWFYRKVGYTLDRRRVAIVSLIFSIFFAITRNLMILPYWAFVYHIFGSEGHVKARARLPGLDISWFLSSLTLDVLNIYWAIMVYPIGINAAIQLYKADWRTDFDRARDKLRDRFTSARRRAMNNELINRLRRTASFNRIQRAWEDFRVFPGEFSASDIFSMAMSERSSPVHCFYDDDDDDNDELSDISKRGDRLMTNHTVSDDEVGGGLTITFRRRRSLSNA